MEGFSVANNVEVLFTNVQNDRDIGGKVEVNWQQNKFVERKKIFGFNIWHMKEEDDRMFFWAVNEIGFKFVKV